MINIICFSLGELPFEIFCMKTNTIEINLIINLLIFGLFNELSPYFIGRVIINMGVISCALNRTACI